MPSHFMSAMPTIRRNLLALYRSRTPDDESLGAVWYSNSHRLVCDWSEHYGYSIATTACVIAALSPQCEWSRNLIAADELLSGRNHLSISYGPLPANVRKAIRIRDDRAGQTLPYFPCGPKVASFACNLAGDYSVATIDTHMVQAALNDVESTTSLKWGPYAVFAQCVSDVARKVQREPAIVQAILWHTWKRQYPRYLKNQRRRQWHVMGEVA